MENQSTIMYDKCPSSTCSNKVTRTSPSSSNNNSVLAVSDSKHGRSKAQLCLQKIIDVISSGSSEKDKKMEKKKGLGFDLNLTLAGCFSAYDDNSFSSGCSGVIGGGNYINSAENDVGFTSGSILVENCEGECELKVVDVIEVEEEEREEEERRQLSDVTDSETPETEEKGDVEIEGVRKNGEKGYMDFLVEAARLISEDFKEDKKQNRDEKIDSKRRRSKRISNNSRMFDVYEDFEDISPIVKSKRGRNQVLPYKYRDSVLDPWKSTTRSIKWVCNRNRNRKIKRKCSEMSQKWIQIDSDSN